jgi:hypothetical protein
MWRLAITKEEQQGSGDTLRLCRLRNDQLHSTGDQPAVEWLQGPLAGKKWYYDEGVPHRDPVHGPAVVFPDNSCWWVRHGRVVKATMGSLELDGPLEQLEPSSVQLLFDFYVRYFFHGQLPNFISELKSFPEHAWMRQFFGGLDDSNICELTRAANMLNLSAALHCGTMWIASICAEMMEQPDWEERIRKRFISKL